MFELDWSSVATGAIGVFVVIILKTLLDFHLAPKFVRYFSWLPVRNYFREKPPSLAGMWEMVWSAGGSDGFSDVNDRHGKCDTWQLGSYFYSEFLSAGIEYSFFGRIKCGYVVGDWYATNDPLGYFGSYQLEIVDSNTLKGRWIGHSKTTKIVRSDELVSIKPCPHNKRMQSDRPTAGC